MLFPPRYNCPAAVSYSTPSAESTSRTASSGSMTYAILKEDVEGKAFSPRNTRSNVSINSSRSGSAPPMASSSTYPSTRVPQREAQPRTIH
ncbi:hypothetical protein ACHAXT_008885 [Thalassiosira profunda]